MGELGQEGAVAVVEFEVAQVDALQGGEQRDGGGGCASYLDDAGRRPFSVGAGGPVVRGGAAQGGVALGEVVRGDGADAHLCLEEACDVLGELFEGGAGLDLLGACRDGGDALPIGGDREAEHVRGRGEPFELGEHSAFVQLLADGVGIQLVADYHAFRARPFLGHGAYPFRCCGALIAPRLILLWRMAPMVGDYLRGPNPTQGGTVSERFGP